MSVPEISVDCRLRFFLFYLGTDPQKIDVVTKEFQSEIAKLAADGLTEEELVRAKKKLLGEEAIKNQSNGAFAGTVATDELMGLGADNYKKRAERNQQRDSRAGEAGRREIFLNPGSRPGDSASAREAPPRPRRHAETPKS